MRYVRTLLLVAALVAASVARPAAQVIGTGQLTASGATCATAGACASFSTSSTPSLTLQVSGTFSATLQFEGTANGVDYTAITVTNTADGTNATSTTAAGTFSVPNVFLTVRVRCSAYTSGTAIITATRGFATAKLLAPSISTLFLADGLVGSPSLTFTLDTDTGLYRVGADQLGVTTGGTNRFTFGATNISASDLLVQKATPLVIIDGTATAATLQYKASTVLRWEVQSNSSQDFKINRYNGSGVFQDQPISISGSTGLTVINNMLNRTGGTTYLLGTGTSTTGFGVDTNGNVAQYSIAPQINTTSLTTTAAISGQAISNRGDADGSTITLLDNPAEGIFYDIINHAGQSITITASAGESIRFGNATCGTSLVSTLQGSVVRLQASGTGSGATWMAMFSIGTWVCNP